jgi:hypothetical protein
MNVKFVNYWNANHCSKIVIKPYAFSAVTHGESMIQKKQK